MKHMLLVMLGGLAAAVPSVGFAACSSPAGDAGDTVYATNYGVMTFCNGTNWVSMAGGVSVTVGGSTGATTLDELTDVDTSGQTGGDYLKYNGSGWVPDNPFGTLTNGKWCTSDGTTVTCNSDAPVTGNVDRIVSGSISVIAHEDTGVSVTAPLLEVAGSVKLQEDADDVCDSTRRYTVRVNPSTGSLEVCRP